MPKIKVNDIIMYYEIHGSGEPIVFVAGLGADHLVWSLVLDAFANKFQVILFDNRGIGQTDIPTGLYSIEQMANDIAGLCEKLKIKNAHFIGNSMGGYILQSLAYQHPSLVKSLVISNSALYTETCFKFFSDAQLALEKENASKEAIFQAICSWVFSYKFLSQPGKWNELLDMMKSNLFPFTITGRIGQLAALDSFDSRQWVKNINAPTLIISADQDIIFRPALSKAITKEIKNSSYHCFDNCGHLPFIEYPKEFTKIVLKFLET